MTPLLTLRDPWRRLCRPLVTSGARRQVFVLLQFDPGMEYIPNRGTKVDLTREDKS